jgi:myo-inositol catabolism protein IolC
MFGYDQPLYILAFDHRSFLAKSLFGKTEGLDEAQQALIKELKQIIYEGFLLGVDQGVPEDDAAILVDEEYGADIHRDAIARGFITILTTEKSGKDEFEFQYGEDFAAHIEAIQPVFAKALVRYRADGDAELNRRQLAKLKELSDWCHGHGRGFLIEPLVSPTAQEKADLGQEAFDEQKRPALTVDMIRQFQQAGVEPDIWKIEGMENPDDYRAVVAQAKADEREHVSCVVLGRAEDAEHVERWLRAAIGVEGMTGFAIGRTIFWDALQKYVKRELNREQAAQEIASNYLHFFRVFTEQ